MIKKPPLLDRVLCWGLAVCLLASVYLMWRSLTVESSIGCGAGDCADVWQSRWGKILFVPVPLVASVFYVIWTAFEWTKRTRYRGWFAGFVIGAAAWFTWVQAMVIQTYCIDCLAVHGVGVMVSLIALLSGKGLWKGGILGFLSSLLVVGVAQIYGPQPVTHRLEQRKTAHASTVTEPSQNLSPWERPNLGLSRENHPILGNPTAKYVIVELFDYQCLDCRRMAGYLDDLLLNYPDDVCVVLVPVPLGHECNHEVVKNRGSKEGSCDLARMALCVWRAEPEKFQDYHRALIKDPRVVTAKQLASGILGEDRLRQEWQALAGMEPFQHNIQLWSELSGTDAKSLPKLWINKQTLLHGAPSSGRVFQGVMRGHLGLK